jgi:hypothetical protein
MGDFESQSYDENDIEDFEDYLYYYGVEHDSDDDDKDGDVDDDEIKELYF